MEAGKHDMIEGGRTHRGGVREGSEAAQPQQVDVTGSSRGRDRAPQLWARGDASSRVRSGWEIRQPSLC